MAQYFIQNYSLNQTQNFNFSWDIIQHQSSVVITASEGGEVFENGRIIPSSGSPQRFIGAAQFSVHNVAPYDGGVTFRIEIDWSSLLNLWVCITVFDIAELRGIGFL